MPAKLPPTTIACVITRLTKLMTGQVELRGAKPSGLRLRSGTLSRPVAMFVQPGTHSTKLSRLSSEITCLNYEDEQPVWGRTHTPIHPSHQREKHTDARFLRTVR